MYSICDNCGKTFKRKASEVVTHKFHFCCRKCMDEYYAWNESDRNILRTFYRQIKTRDIIPMLSKRYSLNAIKNEAIRLNLSKSRLWSASEEQILIDNYSIMPLSDLIKLLPKRTAISIQRKAVSFNLLSYDRATRFYSEEDLEYLKNNYLDKTNDELAEHLGRTPYAIEQKLRSMCLNRPIEITKNYCDLSCFIRSRITVWRDNVRKESNYTCSVTGSHSNIIVHHCRSFNLLLDESIKNINFVVKDSFEDYNDNDLNMLADEFIRLQDEYGEYVCVNEDVHKLFHYLYGFGNNTMDQWNEFVHRYKNGEFKNKTFNTK